MSAPSGQIPSAGENTDAPGARAARGKGELARTGVVIALAVVATLFAVLNLEEVSVDWIVGSGHAPLIIVVVLSFLVGVVLTHFAERRRRRG
jgi:uncharacterized integral membrane protein